MAAWSRLRSSSSSSTSPSSSTTSSSASLQPPHQLLDVADELWFYSSVVPLPSLSLPCLPSLFSSSPDPSTLIAQCMISHCSPSPSRFPLSSSSSLPPPPTDSQPQTHVPLFLHEFAAYPAPPDVHPFGGYDEKAYSETGYTAYSSSSESDEDEDAYGGYPHGASPGEDEEAYYYYTAPSDWDDEDAQHGNHVPSDCEDEQQEHAMKEEVLRAHAHQRHAHLEPDDALSGIYDAVALLKDQHQRRTREVSYARHQREAALRLSHLPLNQAYSDSEQGELKENIKLWAHLVVSTLAAQARPVL